MPELKGEIMTRLEMKGAAVLDANALPLELVINPDVAILIQDAEKIQTPGASRREVSAAAARVPFAWD